MKTTIDLPDELVRQVKGLARTEGVTMRELVVEGLRSEIERRSGRRGTVDFVFRTASGEGVGDDVDPSSFTARAHGLPT